MLGFLFAPLLVFKPVIVVSIFSTIILITINLLYRFLANQSEIRQIKERMNGINKEIKEKQKSGDTAEANKLMAEVMQENSRMMKMNMKPMMASFVIVILFLPWLSATFSDQVINLEGGSGEVTIAGETYMVEKTGSKVEVTGSSSVSCEPPCRKSIGGSLWNIYEDGDLVHFQMVVAVLPVALPFFGDDLGWLGWYFIFSVPMIILIRKILKISM